MLRGIADEASRAALEGTGPIMDIAMKWGAEVDATQDEIEEASLRAAMSIRRLVRQRTSTRVAQARLRAKTSA